jgi:ferric iron reductase protein FhuF
MMVDIDRLSSVFQGPFARFGAALAVTPMADDIPVTAYLSIEAIAVHLDGFGQRYPAGSDRRAVASLWSKTYLRGLIPAPMIALVGGVPLDLSPDKGALRADASAVVLGAASGGEAALAGLYAHLDLLAQALKGSTRLAPRVVWSNAANLLTATLERLEAVAPPATALRETLLETAKRPDGSANPLFHQIRWIAPGVAGLPEKVRQRRVCCVRDLIAGQSLCSTCPKMTVDLWLERVQTDAVKA